MASDAERWVVKEEIQVNLARNDVPCLFSATGLFLPSYLSMYMSSLLSLGIPPCMLA